jgi:hypothetical protein
MDTEATFEEVEVEAPTYEGVRLAYIKRIGLSEARALGIIPSDIKLPDGVKLYAIHAADGTPIAIMDNWASAYGAAVQNDFVPVSVH